MSNHPSFYPLHSSPFELQRTRIQRGASCREVINENDCMWERSTLAETEGTTHRGEPLRTSAVRLKPRSPRAPQERLHGNTGRRRNDGCEQICLIEPTREPTRPVEWDRAKNG